MSFAKAAFAATAFPPAAFPPDGKYSYISKSKISNALLSIKETLINYSLFNEPECVITVLPQIPQSAGSPLCLIKFMAFDNDQGYTEGGGRYNTVIRGNLRLRINLRNLIDRAYADMDALTSKNIDQGIYTLTENIINVIHASFPEDEDGNLAFCEPPRFARFEQVERETDSTEYLYMDIFFTCAIELELDRQLWMD